MSGPEFQNQPYSYIRMSKIGPIHIQTSLNVDLSYTALRISIPINKANLLKLSLKENSYFKQAQMIEKVFKYRNIEFSILR